MHGPHKRHSGLEPQSRRFLPSAADAAPLGFRVEGGGFRV